MITLQISPDHSRLLGRLSNALLVHPTTVALVVDTTDADAEQLIDDLREVRTRLGDTT